jgi:hypothetical protein
VKSAKFSRGTTEVEIRLLGMLKAAPYGFNDIPDSKTFIYMYAYHGASHALTANNEFLEVYAPYKEYYHDSHTFYKHFNEWFSKTKHELELYESE